MPSKRFQDLIHGRANNFDFLRFFFATMVIYGHAFILCRKTGAQDLIMFLTRGQLRVGDLAVDAFFAISGLLVTASWDKTRNWRVFFRKRFLRIYPGFLVAVLISVFIAGPLAAPAPLAYFRNPEAYKFMEVLLLHNVRSVPGIFPNQPSPGVLNLSLWTIRWEIFCYGLVAAMGAVGWLGRRAWVVAAFVCFYSLLNFVNVPEVSLVYFGILNPAVRLICYFLAGSIFYLYRERIPYSSVLCVVSLAILTFALGGGESLAMPIFGSYTLFYAAYSPRLPMQNLVKLLRGDLSYGLYLYSYPIEQLLVRYFGGNLQPIALFLVAWPITLAVATLSWHFIEAPCLRFKSQSPVG